MAWAKRKGFMLASISAALLLAPVQSSGFADTWKTVETAIRTRYYARDRRKAEMDALLAKYGPKASAAPSRAAFRDSVKSMIAEFADSHFDLATDEDQAFYFMDSIMKRANAKQMPHIGVWFDAPTKDGYPIKMVLTGLAAEKSGLRKGDVITKIEGQPFTPIASLKPFIGRSAEVEYLRAGQAMKADVSVGQGLAINVFFDATRNSARIIERDGKRFAYFRCWSMIDDMFKNFLTMFATRGAGQETDGFILDLRDGFGGRPEGYYETFFAPEIPIAWHIGQITQNQISGYSKPMVVLTNRGTRSAKEVVSHIFKASKRAVLVGDTTAGDVLGTSPMPIQDWAYLEIPMVDLTIGGKRLERAGVDPDVAVANEYDAAGRDLYLERGLSELLARTRTGTRAGGR